MSTWSNNGICFQRYMCAAGAYKHASSICVGCMAVDRFCQDLAGFEESRDFFVGMRQSDMALRLGPT